jgi:phospholipase/carboxylesterase
MKSFLISFLLLLAYNTMAMSNPSLIYLVREPKIKTDKPPLLILLHGAGGNEQEMFSLASHMPDEYLVVSARGPIVFGARSFAWYHVDLSSGKPVINSAEEKKSRTIILDFIEALKLYHAFDDTKVYLCGFSQGAIMSYSVGFTHPDKVKGIIALSGRLLEEVKPLMEVSKLTDMKIFIGHGTNDNVLSVYYARDCARYLRQAGIGFTLKEYPEGHRINAATVADIAVWLSH